MKKTSAAWMAAAVAGLWVGLVGAQAQAQCMYNPQAGAYQECLNAAQGQCAAFGAYCQPASLCMYNRA